VKSELEMPNISLHQPFDNWLLNVLKYWELMGRPTWSLDDDELNICLSLEPPQDCSGIIPPYPVLMIDDEITCWIGDYVLSTVHHIWDPKLLRRCLVDRRPLTVESCYLKNIAERSIYVSDYSADWFTFSGPNLEHDSVWSELKQKNKYKSTYFRAQLNAVLFYSQRPERLIERKVSGRKILYQEWTLSERRIVGPFQEKVICLDRDSQTLSNRKLHVAHWRGAHIVVQRHPKFGRNPNGGFKTYVRRRSLIGKHLLPSNSSAVSGKESTA
jgi:hypothetical protein